MDYSHSKLLHHKYHYFGAFGLLTTSPATYSPDNRMAYRATALLASDRLHLSQSGKRVFAQKLVGLTGRALN